MSTPLDIAKQRRIEKYRSRRIQRAAEREAAKSAGKLTRALGIYGKLLAGAGAALFGTATILDIDKSLQSNLNVSEQRRVQEERIKERDRRARKARVGLPGDPYIGLVQDMYDTRINHTRM